MDDSVLIRAVQRRMPFALEVLVCRYADTVLRLALQMTGSEQAARGIYQAAFREIHPNPHVLAAGPLASVLHGLVARLGLEFLRSNRPSSGPSPAGRGLDNLTPRERVVFVAKHYQGLKLETISEVLETQPGAMRRILLRAIHKMRAFTGENTLEFLLQ